MNTKIVSIFSVLFLSILFVSNASAQERTDLMAPNISEVEQQEINLENIRQVFNENTAQVPEFARSLMGDQTVVIELGEEIEVGNDSIGFKMNDMNITDIKWGSYNDTTLEITVTKDNLETILSSSSPVNRAGTMLETGELQYEALTFGNKVRLGLFRLFTGL